MAELEAAEAAAELEAAGTEEPGGGDSDGGGGDGSNSGVDGDASTGGRRMSDGSGLGLRYESLLDGLRGSSGFKTQKQRKSMAPVGRAAAQQLSLAQWNAMKQLHATPVEEAPKLAEEEAATSTQPAAVPAAISADHMALRGFTKARWPQHAGALGECGGRRRLPPQAHRRRTPSPLSRSCTRRTRSS